MTRKTEEKDFCKSGGLQIPAFNKIEPGHPGKNHFKTFDEKRVSDFFGMLLKLSNFVI